ncbi:MAG: tetraacyldisaccharide 4'-kinase [Bacteroidia bacterium]|nr:tetraacyldisaccharide 4'-kinase [Bacteroidia bacterium]
MDLPSPRIRHSLLPLSWLYGLGVSVRNKLFDVKMLKQHKFDIPIICVGNITVGGTGKTPHIEYLVGLLSARYKVAVLSRGYKRKSKGFKIVEVSSKPHEVGDEPLQIKQKFPHTLVVVDKKRRNAIEKIRSMDVKERPEVILMDDGFQHRNVTPSLSILLVDSNRPVYEDKLLPAGNLREPLKEKDRAAMVIVTKCSRDMQPIDFRIYENGLDLFPYQDLYFTTFDYGNITPVFPDLQSESLDPDDLRKKHVFLVTGIASPQPLVEKLELKTYNLYPKFFPDHHFFKAEDIEEIEHEMKLLDVDDDDKIIITTEKDAMRFRDLPFLNEEFKKNLYYIPVEVLFLEKKDKESFNKKINKHVRSYQANSRLSKK